VCLSVCVAVGLLCGRARTEKTGGIVVPHVQGILCALLELSLALDGTGSL